MSTIPGPYAHTDGHDTEREAAEATKQFKPTVSQRVFRLLVAAGNDGLTDDEGGKLYAQQYDPNADRLTFGRRRNELKIAGLVKDSGQRRPGPRGKRAIVWTVNRDAA